MSDISYLQISTKTCSENCQGLVDFSSFQYDKKSWKVTKPCSLYFTDNKCYIPTGEAPNGSVGLVGICKTRENFCACVLEDGEKVWRVVMKSKKAPNGLKINEGDFIKIGKVVLGVKVFGLGSSLVNSRVIQDFFEGDELDGRVLVPIEGNGEGEDVCRICLNESNTKENPLLSPCNCSGTMKAIHQHCLQKWVQTKVTARISSKTTSFLKKDICCELCSKQFPLKVLNNHQEFLLINFPSSSSLENFIALEEFSTDQSQKLALHLINIPENNKASIGRSVWSDLKFKDISVSRKHCKLKRIGSDFYLKDKQSKYGTLVEVQNEVEIRDAELTLQVGRTVFKITHKRPCNFKNCCKKNNKVDCEPGAGRTLMESNDGPTEVAGFIENC